jgi:putative tricarboxylic transport membrane protein
MRRADLVTGLALLVFGVGYAVIAWRAYPYWSSTGPGSGFLPVWVGAVMAALALLLVLSGFRRRPATVPEAGWLPEGRGLVRLVVVVAAIALFAAVMDYVGMIFGSALFLLGVLRFLERFPWPWAIGIAVGVAGLIYGVFTYWLQVPFPTSPLGI